MKQVKNQLKKLEHRVPAFCLASSTDPTCENLITFAASALFNPTSEKLNVKAKIRKM